jgi:hypothetical protein
MAGVRSEVGESSNGPPKWVGNGSSREIAVDRKPLAIPPPTVDWMRLKRCHTIFSGSRKMDSQEVLLQAHHTA